MKSIIKEVPRTHEAPHMTDELVELLTSLCFRKNDELPLGADTLFVFGSISSLASMVCELTDIITKEKIRHLIISGGRSLSAERKIDRSESDIILEHIDHLLDGDIRVITEETSTNSLENVKNALDLCDLTNSKSLCFVHKYHTAGRALLTLQKFLPDMEFKQRAFASKNCSPETWFKDDHFRKLVWGEFLRIEKYSSRGDIEFSSVESIVNKINKLTATHPRA